MGSPVKLVISVSYLKRPPARGVTLLVTRTRSEGGLKKVMRLEVSEADDVVTPEEVSDRPGRPVKMRCTVPGEVWSKVMSELMEKTCWVVSQVQMAPTPVVEPAVTELKKPPGPAPGQLKRNA